MLFLLVISPVIAIPIYSYDDGIQTLNNASLSEIDRLAEEFSLGEFDVSKGDRAKEFYELLSLKMAAIPKVIKTIEELHRLIPGYKNAFSTEVPSYSALVKLYVLASLINDPPDVFKNKYPKFLTALLTLHNYQQAEGMTGLFELASIQTYAIFLHKESLTSEEFINKLNVYKNDSSITNSEVWEAAMGALGLTNLRIIARVGDNTAKLQEEMLKPFLINKFTYFSGSEYEKYKYIVSRMAPIIRGGYQFSFLGLDSWFDMLWENYQTPEVISVNTNLLSNYFRNRANWELKITPEKYLEKTLELANRCDTDFCAGNQTIVISAIADYKRKSGKFKEAEDLTKKIEILNKRVSDIVEVPLPALLNQLLAESSQGKYAEADNTKKQIQSFVDEKSNFPLIEDPLYQALRTVYLLPGIELDMKMGRFQSAKSSAESLILLAEQNLDKDPYNKFTFLELKFKLLLLLGKAEIELGNIQKGKELIDYVTNFNGGGNNFSFLDYENKFWEYFWSKNFDQAYIYIKEAEIKYSESIQKTNNMRLDVVLRILKGEAELAKQHLGKSQPDFNLISEYYKKYGTDMAKLYYVDIYDSYEARLNILKLNWLINNAVLKNPQAASFYAKQYINILQEIRSGIKVGDATSLGAFTSVYKDTLQQMSLTFFSYSDFESANRVLNIIKENEFLDFSGENLRAGIIETFLSYNFHEKNYLEKIAPLKVSLITTMEAFIELNKSNPKEADILTSRFNAKLEQIGEYWNIFLNGRDGVMARKNSDLYLGVKDSLIIQSIISSNNLIFRLSFKGKYEQIIIPIEREKLRLMIYQLYTNLSTPTQSWRENLALLDSQVFSKLNTRIKEIGINKIYFSPDDALTFLSPDLIFNTQQTKLEIINLTNTKLKVANKTRNIETNLDVFAAT